jgi:hypothetical protein
MMKRKEASQNAERFQNSTRLIASPLKRTDSEVSMLRPRGAEDKFHPMMSSDLKKRWSTREKRGICWNVGDMIDFEGKHFYYLDL